MKQHINLEKILENWLIAETQTSPQVWLELENRILEEERAFKGIRISYASSETEIGTIWVASSEQGLCRLVLPTESQASFWNWLKRRFSGGWVREDGKLNQAVIDQIHAYLDHELTEFDLKCDVRATPFQQDVLDQIAKIPFGELASYSDIAKNIGKPIARRAVGAATGSNPIPIVIPCHRVVGTDGRLVGYGGGLPLKEQLLLLEGHHIQGHKLVPKSLFD